MDKTPGIRPRRSWGQRLDRAARHGFPAAITIAGMILLAAPFGLPGQAQLMPAFTLAAVFFWSLFRPTSLPPPLTFLLGLLADLLGEMPLGTNVLILLLTQLLVVRSRRYLPQKGFLFVWLVFVAVAAVAALLQWGFACLMSWVIYPPIAALAQFLLTAGLYPLLAMGFTQAHRSIAAPERV
ncbi:rod shape-determining protein MreD [Acidisoma cellulosilytica]|uniref:Rod shape-determining protein MreD n=1 Tax=Acidisoma cellulosilyticum TaxID=2802395 RepID=A0A964E6I5_9PROT|nr:rod shape-determining protein MreD [Acidisoma cellulosilyticum]MCB8883502.1 rod shape-determining protein MreD [Acidisoma cellulosilyticum]